MSDFGRLGSQQHFGPQPRANLYGVRLGQERIPVPHSGPLVALRGSQATRWAKKKSPHWAAIWPHVPYVCTDTPNRSPRTHSRPRLWDPASGAVLPPMGDSRPGLRPTPGPSRPRRGTESAHRCTQMHFPMGWGLVCSRPPTALPAPQTRPTVSRDTISIASMQRHARAGMMGYRHDPPSPLSTHAHRAHVRACCVARTCPCACTYTFTSFRLWDARPTSPACCVWLPSWQPGSKTRARGKRCTCCF